MKKVFTKIAGLSVGLAMAIGVGVAVGARSAKVAKATYVPEYTLDGTTTGSGSQYAGDNSITQSGVEWIVNGNISMNPWRIGGKKVTSPSTVTDYVRLVKSNAAVSVNDIAKVELTVGAASSITVNRLKLLVGTSAGASDIDSVEETFAANSTITFSRPEESDWSGRYFTFEFDVTITATSNKYVEFKSAVFYKESSAPRGEIEINELSSPIVNVEASGSLSYSWTPASGSSATIDSYSWVSSNSEVLSISGNTYTGVAPGVVTVTLNATDSNDEEYSVQSGKIYVTNEYEFAIGDNVVLYSSDVAKELSGINKDGSNHYGIGSDYSPNPVGLYALSVEEGTVTGSFAFKNGSDYLIWSSGNTLSTSASKSINTSWFVIAYDDYMIISNAADAAREIWWNNGNPRFACYTGKTPTTSGYNTVSLMVIADVPVRGTVAITAPTDTLLRQGASGSATFSWTPAEESSATIVSYSWTSSDTAVFSVSGDTYTAVGPGKAKLTLNATDSNGQEYQVSTNDITVVSVVSGTYEKVYKVNVGDTVAIVCEADGTQLSGVASKIGSYVFYEDAPDSVFDFVLEEGSVEGSFALKSSEDTYLAWIKEGAADIGLVEDVSESSSWTIEFENGNAKITNCALDGDSHRFIAWNHSSPRFAAYKGQTAVQLYAPAIELDPTAVAFANKIISDITCDATGKTKPSASVWSTLEGQYASVSEKGKEQLAEIFAVHHEEPSTDKEIVEEALAKYDYIVGKYFVTGLDTSFTDFVGRNPSPVSGGAIQRFDMSGDNNTMVIVISIAAISALAFTTLLVFKKKRQK